MRQHRLPVHATPAAGTASKTSSGDLGRLAPQLASISKGGRLVAFATALLATTLSVGSQLGLLTHYSGEADLVPASLRPASTASQVIASAVPLPPHRTISTKFDPTRGSRRPWEHAQQPNYARNEAQP